MHSSLCNLLQYTSYAMNIGMFSCGSFVSLEVLVVCVSCIKYGPASVISLEQKNPVCLSVSFSFSVSVFFLCLSRPEYLQLPFQAVMCSLDGISPKDGTNEWSAEACDLLLQLTGAGMWKTLVLEVISLPRGSKSPDSLFPEPALVDLVDTSSVSWYSFQRCWTMCFIVLHTT